MVEQEVSFYSTEVLHPYTETLTNTFCYRLVNIFRASRLSKTECRTFFDLIHSALPNPNNLPSNMNQLLSMFQLKHNLFKKRKICLLCYKKIGDDVGFCSDCPTSNEATTAIIYDSDIKSILSLLLKKLWKKIRSYKEELQANNDASYTSDIGFAYAYQNLLRQFSNETFI
ncbi:unnamed protein product [Rotaria sp. Silwood1]|nr:unnamed protein product [Rotaria sp. Silwood1]CAF1590764.1 unnamed protein product [Rotaria sp. Silwood1]CAF1590938.1 unnamed protein product [Rotaria sp. Silwood1]